MQLSIKYHYQDCFHIHCYVLFTNLRFITKFVHTETCCDLYPNSFTQWKPQKKFTCTFNSTMHLKSVHDIETVQLKTLHILTSSILRGRILLNFQGKQVKFKFIGVSAWLRVNDWKIGVEENWIFCKFMLAGSHWHKKSFFRIYGSQIMQLSIIQIHFNMCCAFMIIFCF